MVAKLDLRTPPKNLDTLLESGKAELEALDPSTHVRRVVSRERALELTAIVLRSFAGIVEQIDVELSPVRAKQRKLELARLDARVWLFYAADLAAQESHSNARRTERLELAERVREHDRFLFKWAMPLFGDDPELGATLRDISPGTGARDDAEDVLRLVALYRGQWTDAKGKTVVTQALLDAASADATAQLDLLRLAASNPVRTLADAAYTLWYHDYQTLVHLGRYLSSADADSRARFPGVRSSMTSGSSRAEPDAKVGDDETGDVSGGLDGTTSNAVDAEASVST